MPMSREVVIKISFILCPSCQNITPAYENPEYGHNCIYPVCKDNIPFDRIIELTHKKHHKGAAAAGRTQIVDYDAE